LPLASPQAPKEGFQVSIGAVAFGPRITLEEAVPALAKARADLGDHIGVLWTGLCVVLQLGQKLFEVAFDL
jgi:hypothetical protein